MNATLKFGPFENDDFQPYGKIGLNTGFFSTTYTEQEASYTHSKTHVRLGLSAGVGIQKALRGHRGFLDYTFTAYSPLEYNFKDYGGETVYQNFNPLKTHKIMVGVHFLV